MALEDLKRRYEQLQGLLNTGMNQPGGLLGNIPQAALLGSAIYSQGVQGRDPFAALLPAAMQTAQLQKYMTPEDKRTPLQKNLEAAGLKPGTPEYQEALLEATKKQPLIQQTGEGAFTKRMGEIYGDEFKNILESSNVAIDNQSIISSARTLLNQEDLKTGIDAPLRTTAQRVANALGIDVNLQNVTAAQLLQQSTGDLVLNDLGKFKGAISDGERKFAIDKNVNLGQTKEGIAIRLELMEKAGEINLKYAEAAEDWVQRNKTLQDKDIATGQTWSQFKKQFRKENPLINEDFKKRIDNAVKEQPDFALQGNIKVIEDKTYYKHSDGSWHTEPEKK